jgi:mono/diheme cytochrome c family protein
MPRSRLLLLFVLAPLVLGCGGPTPGDPYDPHWRYPARQDPLVLKAPPEHPTEAVVRTTRDEYLRTLPDRGGVILDPSALPADTKQKLAAVLDDLFGTPAEPKVGVGDPASLAALALDADTLKAASGQFRVRCATCHGMAGDGRGASGLYIYPHPRDYRSGRFKLATGAGHATGRPRFDDLLRVVKAGVPGTPMIAFGVVPHADLRGLVGSVIHLSVRGEVEQELLKLLADPDESSPDLTADARRLTADVLKKWEAAQATVPPPPAVPDRPAEPTPGYHESIRRGFRLFTAAGCLSCHEGYHSRNVYRFDVWGLPNGVRNLTDPVRRWGADAADTARQIRHGIAAANMPGSPVLTDAEVIDLVNFVRELPYPLRLPDDVRSVVEK